jgi:hypothetical protein
MKKAPAARQPVPAAPAPSSSQQTQLLLLAPGAVAFVLPSALSGSLSSAAAAPLRVAALPLYQQNCSFLI